MDNKNLQLLSIVVESFSVSQPKKIPQGKPAAILSTAQSQKGNLTSTDQSAPSRSQVSLTRADVPPARLKPTSSTKVSTSSAQWIPAGQTVTIAGYSISGGMLYVGTQLAAIRIKCQAPRGDVTIKGSSQLLILVAKYCLIYRADLARLA